MQGKAENRISQLQSRKSKKEEYVPKGVKVGRSYEDFLHFIEDNPNCCYSEMDTVIGRIGGKVIMTFQFVNVDFMFGILMDNKSAAEGGERIKNLKKKLTASGYSFSQIFPVLLTDNGGEFSNVFAFENDLNGSKESSVFFCDLYSFVIRIVHGKSHTLKTTTLYSETSFLKAIHLMISLRILLI